MSGKPEKHPHRVRRTAEGSKRGGHSVSLVIPCHNEEGRLSAEKTLACLKALGDGAKIILVDDGSTDGTREVIRKIAEKSPSVTTLLFDRNAGKAQAVRAGMKLAAEGGVEFSGFCDADFSAPPEEVARVFHALAEKPETNTAMGTRNSAQSENISRGTVRGILSRVFALLSSFALKRRVSDSQCGAKFFRNTPALAAALDEPFISRWGFDVELLGRIESRTDEPEPLEVPLKSWSERPPSGMSFFSMAQTLVEMRNINGDLKKKRKETGNRRGLALEILLTVFVRMTPIYFLTFVFARIMFWEGYWINPDAYYHMGVAVTYAEEGWLSSFPWLKYTVLGDSFSNVYLGQHFLLGIIYFLTPSSDPIVIIKTAIIAMAFLQMMSFYLFLRKWNCGFASIWTVLGIAASSNMLWHTMALKGITAFSIMFPWIVDALWSNNARRAFTIGWMSTYIYVGFIVMAPLAACRIAGDWLFEGRFRIKTPLMLFAGVAVGMVLSPFFPDHLTHIIRELKTVFERPDFIKPGDFFGSEWSLLNRVQIQHFLGGLFLPTVAAVFFFMRKDRGCDGVTGAAIITVFIFALAPFKAGIKFAQQFVVIAILMVPLIYRRLAPLSLAIPKTGLRIRPLVPMAFAFIFFVYSLPFLKSHMGQLHQKKEDSATPYDYRTLAENVRGLTGKGKVVIAPWDDFPGLFYFNRDNFYVSGMNNLFLYHKDPHRFTVYYKFFKGGIHNPAKSIPVVFDGTDLMVVRNSSLVKNAERVEGEKKLSDILEKAPGIVSMSLQNGKPAPESGVVARLWKIYKIVGTPDADGKK